MRQQLLNMDLKVDEGRCRINQLPETKWQKALKGSKMAKSTQRGATKNSKPSQIPVKKSVISSEAREHKHEGIAFEIPFDDVEGSKQCKKKPAIASLQKKDLKEENQEMIALKLEEKQRKAAERRQRRQDARVRKTRESREALMELQTKVNIFCQHQEALDGQADPRMMLSEHKAACLAHEIADGFSSIHSKYKTDLERAEGFLMVYDKIRK